MTSSLAIKATILLLILASLAGIASARSTAICRYDLPGASKDTIACPTDQLTLEPICGDQVCDSTENNTSCPQDCFCGNGTCDSDETFDSCPQDCSQDILKVEIIGTKNQNGEQTDFFSESDTMAVEVKVTNKKSNTINAILSITVLQNEAPVGAQYNVANSFAPKENILPVPPFSFPWSGQQNGTYWIKASVPMQEGEENFFKNNTDTRFITLGRQFGTVSVPETSPALVPIIAFIVLSLIYGFGKKSPKTLNTKKA